MRKEVLWRIHNVGKIFLVQLIDMFQSLLPEIN